MADGCGYQGGLEPAAADALPLLLRPGPCPLSCLCSISWSCCHSCHCVGLPPLLPLPQCHRQPPTTTTTIIASSAHTVDCRRAAASCACATRPVPFASCLSSMTLGPVSRRLHQPDPHYRVASRVTISPLPHFLRCTRTNRTYIRPSAAAACPAFCFVYFVYDPWARLAPMHRPDPHSTDS